MMIHILLYSIFAGIILLVLTGAYTLRLARTLTKEDALGGNDERCKTFKGMFIVLEFPLTILLCGAWFVVLKTLGQCVPTRSADVVFALRPQDGVWLCFSLFFGLATAMLVVQKVFRHFLGKHYRDFEENINQSYGFNAMHMTRILCVVFIAVGVLLLPFIVNTYAFFGSNELIESSFFQIHRNHHPYSNIKEIRLLGNCPAQQFHQIEFYDGFVWDSSDQIYGCDMTTSDRLVRYVASRCGLAVTEAQSGARRRKAVEPGQNR